MKRTLTQKIESPRRNFGFSTWRKKISTWATNETSEESNETSEEMFLPYVENKKYPRGDLIFFHVAIELEVRD